jgi:Spy/CpxP family protein refolding chaperone
MKRVMVVLVLGLIFVVWGAQASDAQMCKCMDKMGEGMGGGMHMMGGMKHEGMESMGGMMRGGMGMKEEMKGEDHPMWKHLMALGLDEKQKDAVREIKSRLAKDTIRKKAEKQVAKIEMKDILAKDPVDMKAVETKLRQKESLETDIRLAHIKAMEEVKAKLTPEQRKKMKEMMELGGMMGGMGMMKGCGMMGGMMQHGDMGGATQPSEKKDQPAKEHKHH